MMRPLYTFLKFSLIPKLWIYYPYLKMINRPHKRYARTIFMSNHSASFMDPLIVGGLQSPFVFFMTRADIFTPMMKPILWASQMLPIYRQQDGEDTKARNNEVFKTCSKVLDGGRSLLIFAEGFTDDVFVRRLKPVKKGAIRIGFTALKEIDWKKKIYVQAIGVNYADPNYIGADCVVSNGAPLCLNDYREEYEADPGKVVLELTEKIELDMRNQITDIRNIEMTTFHENIMRITRKGMNARDTDRSIPLLERWKYSKDLADWFNKNDELLTSDQRYLELREDLENYFQLLEEKEIEETPFYKVSYNKRRLWKEILHLIALFPILLLGLIHCYLPYKYTKNWIEKTFKRKVFWGSVKMMVGFAFVSIYNIILFILFMLLFKISFWLQFFVGMFAIPVIGVIAYKWMRVYKQFKMMNKIEKMDTSGIGNKRRKIELKIAELISVA